MKRTFLFKLFSITFGTLMGFLLAEFACRVHYFGVDGISFTKVNSFVPLGKADHLVGTGMDQVPYTLKPNLRGYFKLKSFQTNSLGLRDKEYPLTKARNTIRGMVIGDSFTMGSGVEIEHVYHSLVEERLNERYQEVSFELWNFGVGGYDLWNYLGVMEQKILHYEPDFILIGFCGDNDFMEPVIGQRFVPKEKPLFNSYFFELLNRNLLNRNSQSPRMINDAEKACVEKSFKAFKDFSNRHHIPIMLQYLSVDHHDGNLSLIKDMIQQQGLPFIESSEQFDRENLSQYLIVPGLDAHPNPLGHAIYAETLLSSEAFNMILDSLIATKTHMDNR